MMDATAKGTLHAEELLGESTCKHLSFIHQTNPMEGIEPTITAGKFSCSEQPHPIVGAFESSKFAQPIPGVRHPLAGQYHPPIAGAFESSKFAQPIPGVHHPLAGQDHPPIAGTFESSKFAQPIPGVHHPLAGQDLLPLLLGQKI